jgi:hypothetical protein
VKENEDKIKKESNLSNNIIILKKSLCIFFRFIYRYNNTVCRHQMYIRICTFAIFFKLDRKTNSYFTGNILTIEFLRRCNCNDVNYPTEVHDVSFHKNYLYFPIIVLENATRDSRKIVAHSISYFYNFRIKLLCFKIFIDPTVVIHSQYFPIL